MIQQNNNISVLPWYKDKRLQNHRLPYAYGHIYPLYTPARTLLPFQIIRPHNRQSIRYAALYNKDGSLFKEITNALLNTGLEIVQFVFDGYDVITYPAKIPMPIEQPDGVYYAVISDGPNTWYSEMFTVVGDITPYLKIEWYDEKNLYMDNGAIVYRNPPFKNVLYLCAEVGKPEYPFEESGETRDGAFFPEKQISSKTYKSIILGPEYLCDVMRFIRMADFVTITDKYGRVYNCDTFLITPRWQTQGDLASIEMEWTTDTAVKKLGVGYIRPRGGDYNDDYNIDYNNQK